MKCRRCGAENAIHMTDCGNCGMSLSPSDSSPGTDEGVSQSPRYVANKDVATGFRPSQVEPKQHPPKSLHTGLLVPAIILLVLGLVDLLISYVSGDGLSIKAAFIALSGVIPLAVFLYIRNRGSRMAQYIWQSGDLLAPIAESRGMIQSGLLIIPFAMAASIVVGLLFFSEMPILLHVAIGLLVSVALVIGFVRSKVMIQSDCVLVGVPSGLMMLRLPFKKMHSVRLRGRLLKVVLTEKINPMSSKTHRYLILGDPKPVATAIQAFGMIHGIDITVENVEIDSELLKSCMKTIQHKDEDVLQRHGDKYVIDEKLLAPKRSPYPEIISALLLIAGVSALFTAFLITVLSGVVAEDIGRHLTFIECCAILEFLFGALIIAGAVMARKRKRYGLVRMSAIVAIISFGGLISTILGIISLILLMKSADEFDG